MGRIFVLRGLLIAVMTISGQSFAQDSLQIGGDVYVSDTNTTYSNNSPRSIFASGFTVTLDGDVEKDAHVAGFDVEVEGRVGADLYAVGASVSIEAPIGDDLTASGFNVRLKKAASVGGNTRIGAGTVTIDAPLTGSLVVAAGDLTLNAPISGDARITASEITFGENAKISGILSYSAPEEIEIPASVISADRVRYSELKASDMYDEWHKAFDGSSPSFWKLFAGIISAFIITLAFLLIVAAVFLAFKPETVERLRHRASNNVGTSLLCGFLGMATLWGLVPVSAMTIVGAPLIPIVILAIVAFWTLGYLLGAYAVFWRIAGAFGTVSETTGMKLFVIGVGLAILAILNFIPILGWLINLAIIFIGLGSITIALIGKLNNFKTA